MLSINETTQVRIRPSEPVNGLVKVDFHYSNSQETNIARETAFLRVADRVWASKPPVELSTETLDLLFMTYNSESKSPYYRGHLYVDARKCPDDTFDVNLEGSGLSLDMLGIFFSMLREYRDFDDTTFLTLPVIRELEDPELMTELDLIIKEINDDTAKKHPMGGG